MMLRDWGIRDPVNSVTGEQTQKVLIRGRGTSMAGYHFQTALPQVTVGDQVVRVGDAIESITQVVGDGGSAAKLKILPERVTLR